MIKSKSLESLLSLRQEVELEEQPSDNNNISVIAERDSLLREKESWKHTSTELHSIIAHLKKQLEQEKTTRIREESGEESSPHSENEDDYFEEYFDDSYGDSVLDNRNSNLSSSDGKCEEMGEIKKEKEQQLKLHNILLHLQSVQREQHRIQQELKEKETLLEKAMRKVKFVEKERDELRNRVHQFHSIMQQPHPNSSPCKIATRIRLRPSKESTPSSTFITGATLTNALKSVSAPIVSAIVNLNHVASVAELATTLTKDELLLHVEKQETKIEKLENEIDYLLGKLGEAKDANEELVETLGKVESWGMGWRVIAERGESTIGLYDILVALLESELGLLLSNIKAAGIGQNDQSCDEDEVKLLLHRAEMNRETAVGAANRVLADNGMVGGKENERPSSATVEPHLRSLIISYKTATAHITQSIPEYDFNFNRREMDFPQVNTRKLDLETAVLMQELLATREDKAELQVRVKCVERENLVLKEMLKSRTSSVTRTIKDHSNNTSNRELNNNNNNDNSPSVNQNSSEDEVDSLPLDLSTHAYNSLLDQLSSTKARYKSRIKLLENHILFMKQQPSKI